MTEIDWNPTPQQYQAYELLQDTKHTEVLFGGGAGGGKSLLGCAWIILSCLRYPGTRWLMGRAELKALKQSTLLTFFEMCNTWGFRKDEHYKYSEQSGAITWKNGSTIYLKDLKQQPSDPNFDSLGSTEYTGAFIDESSEVTTKAKNIVMSRIRHKLDENGLVPKLLICSNPAKNWMYSEFYKPNKEKKMEAHRAFVPALAKDNPYISPHYIANLKKMDKASKERLLYGNWEYDDDPSKLFEYEKLLDMFTNKFAEKGKSYLSVDVARFGKDTTTILVWDGLNVVKAVQYAKSSVTETAQYIEKLASEYKVPRSRIVVDEDGVGGGVCDILQGVYGFVNNSKALPEKGELLNYANLKTQCYFKLSQHVRTDKIAVVPEHIKDGLIMELEQVKRKNIDKDDQKLRLIDKETMKEHLGRSPDIADSMMMRMVFEITQGDFVFLDDPEGLVV